MKSKKLRKLVASVAMLAMTLSVFPGGEQASAATSAPNFEANWSVNAGASVTTIGGTYTKLTPNASKTDESVISVERIETKALTSDVTVDGSTIKANDSTGGVARIGVRLGGDLERELRSYINDAVSEYRDNVNTVNSNRHNNGTSIKTQKQEELGKRLYSALNVKDANGNSLNADVRFIVTYELSDGRVRTTSTSLTDLKLDAPNTVNISSVSDLNALVDENGLVYFTLRNLPTDVKITNIELDSRKDLTVATNGLSSTSTEGTASKYSVQKSLSYNAGSVNIPTSTWVMTQSLYGSVNGQTQMNKDANNDDVIKEGEQAFIRVSGNVVTLVDLFKDPNKTIKSVTFTDRRGDTFEGEVGNLEDGLFVDKDGDKHNISYGDSYKDVKITGLNARTTYDFEYMDIYYTVNGEERSQRVRFDNSVVTGGVTGNKYLSIATSDYTASQIVGFNQLGSTLYQVYAGQNRLTYLVKVNDTTNFERIEVRGLRGGETYTVKDVKSEDGKNSKSKWFAVEIDGVEQNRDYSFLSLETVYNDGGRERYGTPISLGRDSSSSNTDTLFPYNTSLGSNARYNEFTTTNKDYKSEAWVDSELKYEQIPGGVRFYGRVKDADSILNGVTVYVNNGGSYEKIDDSQVKFEQTYRVVKGVDVNADGNKNSAQTIKYPGLDQNITFNENNVESASKMVEITITGLDANKSKDFRFEFTTSEDGNRVSSINKGDTGAFGSIPTSSTMTQKSITRYASGRAGETKVEVSTSDVKVSDITTSSAVVTANIKNNDKESITVELSGSGVNGVTAKYDVEKNRINLEGLKPNTDYKDLKLTLKYGTKSTTLDVPSFKTTSSSQSETGVAGYVSKVYRTFFNREADKDGLLYWTSRLASGQETLKGFLKGLAFTPELLEKNLTNTQFVESMYAIVDRPGEAEGIKFWVDEIEKGIKAGKTQSEARADVVTRMIDTDEVKEIAKKLGIKFE